ncbi:MAG: hypothetical protein WAX14_12225 [Rhodococcus sp. (in: high G+C Gram-positive bacteria)]|uniref:hypothetical protein n=1 Tax=Rhodococcus sp. TaxID=1831 RepID=UPI003BB51BEE
MTGILFGAAGPATAAPAPLPVNDVADGGWWEWGLYGKNTQDAVKNIGSAIWKASEAYGNLYDPLNNAIENRVVKPLKNLDDRLNEPVDRGCTRSYPHRDGDLCYNWDTGRSIPAKR